MGIPEEWRDNVDRLRAWLVDHTGALPAAEFAAPAPPCEQLSTPAEERTEVAQAVAVQMDIDAATGVRLLLGTVLVLHGRLDAIAYYQLVALRLGIRFVRYDIASLDRVKAGFLRRYPG